MKAVFLIIVLLFVFVLTPAKPVKDDGGGISSKHEDKPDVDDELENSGDTDDNEEEDGSTTEEPRMRQKRDLLMELEDEEDVKDSSGDDLEGDEDDSDQKEDKPIPKSGRKKVQSDSDAKELQMQNTLGIRGPFTITALQPPGSQNPSQKAKKEDPFSLNFLSPPGNIEITPLEPSINRMKKVRRRCMCPFPCGPAHSFEVIGCSGPYTFPCGGLGSGWPGLACGGLGGFGGFGGLVPPYGWGGYGGFGGHPLYGGGCGYGGCGGCGGCGCGGGCGYPPIMMCCK